MKNKNITIEDLAGMVKKGFDGAGKRFDGADRRFDGVDRKLKEIDIRLDRMENLKILERRVKRLETALALK